MIGRYSTTKQASVARPVTKRDGCIEGAKDDQVLPNPLEDASPPDLEKVEKVATPFPKVNLMGETKTANQQKFKMLGQTKTHTLLWAHTQGRSLSSAPMMYYYEFRHALNL